MENQALNPAFQPGMDVLKASYRCPHCSHISKGLINYYNHQARYHSPHGKSLKGKKRISRVPLPNEILEAMARADHGIAKAAQELGCDTNTFRKWAKLLVPEAWDEYKQRSSELQPRGPQSFDITKSIWYQEAQSILEGKRPAPHAWVTMPLKRLFKLISWGLIMVECNVCGFHEVRVTDRKMPILIHWKDGNKRNWHYDNLEIYCYNCYYLYMGGLQGMRKMPLEGRA